MLLMPNSGGAPGLLRFLSTYSFTAPDPGLPADDGFGRGGRQPALHVGVLGNTSGMSDRPLPYAFYSGIAVDGRGRLLLSGAARGVVVCDQDGRCFADSRWATCPAMWRGRCWSGQASRCSASPWRPTGRKAPVSHRRIGRRSRAAQDNAHRGGVRPLGPFGHAGREGARGGRPI